MNPLPSPPTDNVYKFIAISGLLVFLAGMVVPAIMIHETGLWAEKAAWEANARRHETVLKFAELQSSNKSPASEEGLLMAKRWNDMYTAANAALSDHTASFETFARHRMDQNRRLGLVLGTTGAFGLLASVLSFRMWYKRVQSVQDQILRVELATAEEELRKARAG